MFISGHLESPDSAQERYKSCWGFLAHADSAVLLSFITTSAAYRSVLGDHSGHSSALALDAMKYKRQANQVITSRLPHTHQALGDSTLAAIAMLTETEVCFMLQIIIRFQNAIRIAGANYVMILDADRSVRVYSCPHDRPGKIGVNARRTGKPTPVCH